MMSALAPLATRVTLPEVAPPCTTSAAVTELASVRKIDPIVVKLMLPEVTTSRPSTSAVRPPIWTEPMLRMLTPPVVVSASNRPVRVSIALLAVPTPLTALMISAPR
jgi:hypothetical protein